MIPSILQGRNPWCLLLWWDSNYRARFGEIFSFVWDTLFFILLFHLSLFNSFRYSQVFVIFLFSKRSDIFLICQFFSFRYLSFPTLSRDLKTTGSWQENAGQRKVGRRNPQKEVGEEWRRGGSRHRTAEETSRHVIESRSSEGRPVKMSQHSSWLCGNFEKDARHC